MEQLVTSLLGISILRFGAVGFVSTVIDLLILNSLRRLGVKVWVATGLGFLAGTINGYILNSLFVFHEAYDALRYEKYLIVSAGGLALTEAIIYVLHVRLKKLTLNQAKLVAVVIVFFWNYGLSKVWAFR